jgi:esterase/lipase
METTETDILINERISAIFTKSVSNDKLPAVILLHGFAVDKNEVNGFYQDLAIKLAQKNIASLRIDFTGWGDSLGDKANTTVSTLLNDVSEAYNYLLKDDEINTTRIGICGFSLGAAITILYTGQNIKIKNIGLMSPVGNLHQDFYEVFGSSFYSSLEKAVDPVHVPLAWRNDVYLNKDFFNSLKKPSVFSYIQQYTGKMISIAGENDFSAKHVRSFQQANKQLDSKFEILKDQDHIFHAYDDQSQMNDVNEKVSNWFKQSL